MSVNKVICATRSRLSDCSNAVKRKRNLVFHHEEPTGTCGAGNGPV
jgi:hypothetical protein